MARLRAADPKADRPRLIPGETHKGKKVHQCSVCGHVGTWDDGWSWYGSYLDQEDGKPVVYMCSKKCQAKVNKIMNGHKLRVDTILAKLEISK